MIASDLASKQPWGFARRFAFWFGSIYLALYLLPFPLEYFPPVERYADAYKELWYAAVPWIGKHILRLGRDIIDLPDGSGDTTFNYVQILCIAALAAVSATLLAWIKLHRATATRIHLWLRIYVRYSLALTMIDYGVVKMINQQFSYPDLDRMIQPYGHSSPMDLLWTFMSTSPAYSMFTGMAECLGGVLLLWRRTTTLGALILAGVLANVVMLDLCYDVPAKLFAMHLLLMSLLLVAPDVGRLTRVLVLNRPVDAATLLQPFERKWLNRSALATKILFLGAISYIMVGKWIESNAEGGRNIPKPPLYGLYEVESFVRNGEEIPPCFAAGKRWRRVVFNRYGGFAVQWMDDSVQRFRVAEDAERGTLTLTSRLTPEKGDVLNYSKPSSDEITLDGELLGDRVQARLRKLPDPEFLLLNRGFHWISERPFNR